MFGRFAPSFSCMLMLFIGCCCCGFKHTLAQNDPFIWGVHVDGTYYDWEIAGHGNYAGSATIRGAKLLPDGSILVVGGITGNSKAKIGDIRLPYPTDSIFSDILIAKMSATGQVIWAKRYGAQGSDFALNVEYNPQTRRIFISASSPLTANIRHNFVNVIGGDSSLGHRNAVVMCLDNEGNGIWTHLISASSNFSDDIAYGISLDENNHVHVSGFVGWHPASLFMASLNQDNGRLNYINTLSSGYDKGLIGHNHIYHNGDIYITGEFQGQADFDPTNRTVLMGLNDTIHKSNIFLACYNASNGALKWVTQAGTENEADRGLGICTDGQHLYITGYVGNNYAIFNNTPVPTADLNKTLVIEKFGETDIFLAKYTLNGELVYARRFGGFRYDIALSVTYNQGKLSLTGIYSSKLFFPNFTMPSIDIGYFDTFVLEVNPETGEPECGLTIGGTYSVEGLSIIGSLVEPNANPDAPRYLYVSGIFGGTLSLPDSIKSTGLDGFITKVMFQTPKAGQMLGTESVCDTGIARLRLEGHLGQIARWEQQPNCRGYWQTIDTTSAAAIEAKVEVTTCFRALIHMGQCTSSTAVKTVVMIPPNRPNAGPDLTTCEPQQNLNGNGQGSWTLIEQPEGANARVTNGQNAQISDMREEGQYRLQWTRTDQPTGCPPQNDVRIITHIPPNSSNAGPDQTICTNSTRLNGNGIGQWQLIKQPNGANAIIPLSANADLSHLSLAGEYTLSYTRTDLSAGCPNRPDSITITVQQPNAGDVVKNRVICWDTVNVRSNGIGFWQWLDFPVGTQPAISDTSNNQITVSQILTPGYYNLSWTRTDQPSSCPDQVDTLSIEFLNDPPSNAGPDSTICLNSLALNGNGTGFWEVIEQPDSANARIELAGRYVLKGLDFVGNYTFRWNRTDIPTRCPNGSDDVVLTVNQFREAEAGSDQTICDDSTTVTGNGEGTWEWVQVPDSANAFISGTPIAQVTGLTVPGTYRLQWQRIDQPRSCPIQYDSLRILVNQANSASLGTDTTTCMDTIALTAPGIGRWRLLSQPTNAQAFWRSIDSSTNRLSNMRVVGNYLVQWLRTDQPEACPAQADTMQIEVVAPLPADAGLDKTVCSDTTTVIGNGNGLWWAVQQPAGAFARAFGGNKAILHGMTRSGLYTIRYFRTDQPANCRRQTDDVNIQVNLLAVDAKVTQAICSPLDKATIEVQVNSDRHPIRYRWSDDSTGNMRTGLAPDYYYVRVIDAAGCTGNDYLRIEPFDSLKLPHAFFSDNQAGNTTLMQSTDVLRLQNGSERANRILWLWNDTTIANSVNNTRTFERSDTFCVRLVAINADGCADTSEQRCYFVDAPYAVHIPNAFSPNKDGVNDRIGGIIVGQLADYRFEVFSTWGRKVFDSQMHNDWWDGTDDGEPAPEGVYVYVITARFIQNPQNQLSYKGTITLLR